MATKNPNLLNIFEKNKYNLVDAAKQSRSWFAQQQLLLRRQNINIQKVMRSDPREMKASIKPGHLYMFAYDPKHKETLPYYDAFPLVFPYEAVKGGFMGLNLHYLPYQMRVILLDRLMVFAVNDTMDETTRLKYSWQLISTASRYAMAQPCIKHYLYDHVGSPFRRIDASDWATAMMLPVEQFVGASREQIWKDSRKKSV